MADTHKLASANGDHDPIQSHLSPSTYSGFAAAEYANDGKTHLLLAASGSVATIKLPLILQALSHHDNLSIRLVLTRSAQSFLAGQSDEQPPFQTLKEIKNVDGIHTDEDEWRQPWVRGAAILHIELRRWSDLLVVAPLSADTLAKMANGFADNLLLSVIRAWDTTGEIDGSRGGSPRKPIMVAPAMNTAMHLHPLTKNHLSILENAWGMEPLDDAAPLIEVLRPVEKTLACGDTGVGAMKEWSSIVARIEDFLASFDPKQPLSAG